MRILSILLSVLVLLSLTACSVEIPEGSQEMTAEPAVQETQYAGFSVPDPMIWPDYSFDHEPTTDELRQMAVKAMRDMLSIQWCTEKELSYEKTGSHSNRTFLYVPDTIYAGLPYANGDTGIIQWLQYYDPETGRLLFIRSGNMLNEALGNTCASCVMWGWTSVCNSLAGIYPTEGMIPLNGVYPVGPYTMAPGIDSYLNYSTKKIIEDNGKEIIFQSYANVLPADALTSEEDDHAMMAIEAAHVEYTPDGQIDGAKSYIMIQDQAAGTGGKFYEVEDGGNILHFSGRTSKKYTFDTLYQKWYIPLTTAEFMGTKAYDKASVTFSGSSCTNVEELLAGSIVSNYPMCVMKMILTDGNGKETVLKNTVFIQEDVNNGSAKNYSMSNCEQILGSSLKDNLEAGKEYTLTVWVAVSTGETFEPVKITVKG